MELKDVRSRYLEFYKKKDHSVIPSASLVPENDPTTLFTGSGMQPLLPYLLGENHPAGDKLVNSQKCFRAEDIDEVGDNRHTTFFEMLGNWSLGSYFKEEQLVWVFSFLVDELKLDPQRLYFTVFSGDEMNGISKDDVSVDIIKGLFEERGVKAELLELVDEETGAKLGMQDARIFSYGAKKNWWSRAGVPENMPLGEPGGPDAEVFYDFGTEHDSEFGENCHPNCDCGRFLEICNSVFMEYKKTEEGSFERLTQRNVDFGGGLERLTAATNNDPDVFAIDEFKSLISSLEDISGSKYEADNIRAFRVIVDHIRGSAFMIADGVTPSNTERGYIVRRLLRRSIRYADDIGMHEDKLSSLISPLVEMYGDAYPELRQNEAVIVEEVKKEESRFRETLSKGMKEFEKIRSQRISGKEAFDLYQTYGFPLEMTVELAEEKGKQVDEDGFNEELKKHQDISRSGASGMFKGGLADHSASTTKLHTAHHLLLAALQEVLGSHVHQRGSKITAERLRIDFSHQQALTEDQVGSVEDLVNSWIEKDLAVTRKEMPKEEALSLGAEMEFGGKYGDTVSVYFIEDEHGNVFSKEFCGGPHVDRTGALGGFKIKKQESVGSGLRRIRAILE